MLLFLHQMLTLLFSSCDETDLYDLAHSQDNSYCNIMLILLQHALIQSIYHEAYSWNLFVNEIILIQTIINYINHIEELFSAAFFKHFESIKLFFDHHILDVADHQNSSHDHNLIASEILCQWFCMYYWLYSHFLE